MWLLAYRMSHEEERQTQRVEKSQRKLGNSNEWDFQDTQQTKSEWLESQLVPLEGLTKKDISKTQKLELRSQGIFTGFLTSVSWIQS